MASVHLICVDLQHEFASPGGRLFRPRECVPFLTDVVFPTARDNRWAVHEIVADYRDPNKPSGDWQCVPGSWAATSLVPRDLLAGDPWVKATPSPAWTRSGAGDSDAFPGPAYPDPNGFTDWLTNEAGPPGDQSLIVVGLMLDVCVLSTTQELSFRGYRPSVLIEGVDTYSGTAADKQALIGALFPFWADPLHWDSISTVL